MKVYIVKDKFGSIIITESGSLAIFNSRIVAQGFMEDFSKNYDE